MVLVTEVHQSVFHGYYLDSQDIVDQIKNNKEATNNIIKSSQWFFSFLERNMYWNDQHDHNQLRITRDNNNIAN